MPSKFQCVAASVDDVEAKAASLSHTEAQWLRASHLATYMKELEELFPLSQEAALRRKRMLGALDVTDPGSFTHVKLAFLHWLSIKSLNGAEDSQTFEAGFWGFAF